MSQVFNQSGRRKTSVASIYLKLGDGKVIINGRDYKKYFPSAPVQFKIEQALKVTESLGLFDIKVTVKGGGLSGQSEATRLGIAKALVEYNDEFRKPLRNSGLLTRDSRVVESKKYGRKKARKKFQFSKR